MSTNPNGVAELCHLYEVLYRVFIFFYNYVNPTDFNSIFQIFSKNLPDLRNLDMSKFRIS